MWYLWCHVLQIWLWPNEFSLVLQKLWSLPNSPVVTKSLGCTNLSPLVHSLLNYERWGGAECEAFHFFPSPSIQHKALQKQPWPSRTLLAKGLQSWGQRRKSAWKWDTYGQALVPSCNITCQHLLIWSQAAKGCSSACKLLGTITAILQSKEQNNC